MDVSRRLICIRRFAQSLACTTAFRDGFVGRQSDERDARRRARQRCPAVERCAPANGPHCPISDHGSRLGNPAYQHVRCLGRVRPHRGRHPLCGSLRRPDDEHTDANKAQAISFAAYRALVDLFPTQQTVLFDPLMESLGYDPSDTTTDTSTPTGIGNVTAGAVLAFRHTDVQSARRSQSRCLFRVPAALRPSQRP